METQKLTIHRALTELKLLDSKISKNIDTIKPIGYKQKDKNVLGLYDEVKFKNDAVSKNQAIIDLIERKSAIKSAIVESNTKTQVSVAGEAMSVADAINHKALIEYKKVYITKLSQERASMVAKMEKLNMQVEKNALGLAEAALQKDNVKISDGDAIAITKPFMDANELKLVDPLKLEELIEKMTDEVDAFEAEVDAVLSESNAVTLIEI